MEYIEVGTTILCYSAKKKKKNYDSLLNVIKFVQEFLLKKTKLL